MVMIFRIIRFAEFLKRTSIPVGRPMVMSFLSIVRSNLNKPLSDGLILLLFENSTKRPKINPTLMEMTVAKAAPITPNPNPGMLRRGICSKMKMGSSTMFKLAETNIRIIGVFESPTHLKEVYMLYVVYIMGRKNIRKYP